MDYLELLNRLHMALLPAVYLEIGVEYGHSFKLSRSRSIAIDPAPRLGAEALVGKPWVKLYLQPSDDFFRTHTVEATLEGYSLDLAFVDGLHEFAQVVRDLENLERWGHPGTIAVIHDVLPRGSWEATRRFQAGEWTGDVWRIVPFLAEYRPDLSCSLVNVAATGVLAITGFDPNQRGMADLAGALDREFPPDGDTYDRLVEAYLRTARAESAETFLGRDYEAATHAMLEAIDSHSAISRIVEATYGAGTDVADVTAQVQARVRDGQVNLTVSNTLFGDPCPNRIKTLRLTYELAGDSQQYQHEAEEHQIVSLGPLTPDPVDKVNEQTFGTGEGQTLTALLSEHLRFEQDLERDVEQLAGHIGELRDQRDAWKRRAKRHEEAVRELRGLLRSQDKKKKRQKDGTAKRP